MASLVISDPQGEFKKRIRACAALMEKSASMKGIEVKFSNVNVINQALLLLEQKLKEEGENEEDI